MDATLVTLTHVHSPGKALDLERDAVLLFDLLKRLDHRRGAATIHDLPGVSHVLPLFTAHIHHGPASDEDPPWMQWGPALDLQRLPRLAPSSADLTGRSAGWGAGLLVDEAFILTPPP